MDEEEVAMSSPISNAAEEEAGASGASDSSNHQGNAPSAASTNQQATQTSHAFVTMDDILAIENEVTITSDSGSEDEGESEEDEADGEEEQSDEEDGEQHGADGDEEGEDEDEDEQVEESTNQPPASPTAHLHPNPTRLSFPVPPPPIGESGRGFADSGADRDVVYDVLGEVSDHMRYPLVVEVVPRPGEEGAFIPVMEEDLLTSEEYWGPFDEDSGMETESNTGDDPARVRFPVPHLGQDLVWGWWPTEDGRLLKGYGRVVNIWINVVKAFVFETDLEELARQHAQQLSDIDEVPEDDQQLDGKDNDQ